MTSPITKVALITGASAGIGRSAASALAAAGFTVLGTSRHPTHVTPPEGVELIDCDVTDNESVTAAVRQVIGRFGRIDVLVNNAGIGATGAVEDYSIDQAQALFDVNVFGVMRMTKEALPHMRARRTGRIINISSVQGFLPAPFMALYGASKHAIEGYSQSLDHEVRHHGIRSILIEPAYTTTGFEANSTRPDTPQHVYTDQRRTHERVLAEAIADGDDPSIVAATIVTAATDKRPRLQYTAGPLAKKAALLHRLAPPPIFDRQIRKLNYLDL